MANEAYVAKQIAETARHPKALLLGAIGAMCPTPSNSANVAEKELGLSKKEIQGARWIALFKKGKTKLEFLNGLLEILEGLEKTKEAKMEIVKFGSGTTVSCACCDGKISPEEEFLLISAGEFKTLEKKPCPPHKVIKAEAPPEF